MQIIKPNKIKISAIHNIAGQIKEIRKHKGISQKELALRMGTSQANISKLESGQLNPTIELLERLVNSMDAELNILIK